MFQGLKIFETNIPRSARIFNTLGIWKKIPKNESKYCKE